jgi:hypothetical protein
MRRRLPPGFSALTWASVKGKPQYTNTPTLYTNIYTNTFAALPSTF